MNKISIKAPIVEIEAGIMTGDMARIAEPKPEGSVGTEAFIDAIASRLNEKLS